MTEVRELCWTQMDIVRILRRTSSTAQGGGGSVRIENL